MMRKENDMGKKRVWKALLTALILAQLPITSVFAAADVVNINPANSAGLSHNMKTELNVGVNGMIFNNAANEVNTVLNGLIAGNTNFNGATSSQASVILNEIVGTSPTSLNGQMEIAGQRADLIIANQRGISANGIGFINTNRAVLTTGQPVIGTDGSISGFNVKEGNISLLGNINAENMTSLDLLGQTVQSSANINADKINVITGNNNINYADLSHSVIEGAANTGTTAIDLVNVGGMYANSIFLVSTADGMGINNAGKINTTELSIDANGDVVNYGDNANLKAMNDILIKAATFQNSGVISAGIDENGLYSAPGNINMELSQESGSSNLSGVLAAGGNITMQSHNTIKNSGLIYSIGNTTATIMNDADFENLEKPNHIGGIVANREVKIIAHNITNSSNIYAGYDYMNNEFLDDGGDVTLIADGQILNDKEIIGNNSISLQGKLGLQNNDLVFSNNNVELQSLLGDIQHGATIGGETSFIGAREKVNVSGRNVILNGSIRSGSILYEKPGSGAGKMNDININAQGDVKVRNDLTSYGGKIYVKGNTILADGAKFSSNGADASTWPVGVMLTATNAVNVQDTDIISDSGYQLNSDKDSVYCTDSYFDNTGNNQASFFGANNVTFSRGKYLSSGKLLANAAVITNDGAHLLAKDQVSLFAIGKGGKIANNQNGIISSVGSISMYIANTAGNGYGTFYNEGIIMGGDWVQLAGGPNVYHMGTIGSDVSISLNVLNAAPYYTNVAAPSVLINYLPQGSVYSWVGSLSSNGLMSFTLTVLEATLPPGFSTLATLANDSYKHCDNDFTKTKKTSVETAFAKTMGVELLTGALDKYIPGSGYLSMCNTLNQLANEYTYKGYQLSYNKCFGKIDEITGAQKMSGDIDAAQEFFDNITGNTSEWGQEIIGDGEIIRISADGTVKATLYMHQQDTSASVASVSFVSLDGNKKFIPFNASHVIYFYDNR